MNLGRAKTYKRHPAHIPPCDVWLGNPQHVDASFVQFDKDAIVDLEQSKKLKNLAYFRTDTIDTVRKGNIFKNKFRIVCNMAR